ncbi:putative bifunctional diguanylate cyclase/phosphodiesterase [Rheinheimera riviphila]|nr:EAL domain-containing protein [Rheinheimera riviphila]
MSKAILLVDDEVAILRALQRVLTRAGYRVFICESAAAGLDLLAQQSVSLVISDFRMPGMKGSDFLAQVKALYPQTLGVILSAYADREALLASLNSGAAWKFLEKPWDDAQLLKDVEAALAEKERRQAEIQRTNLLLSSDEALLELSASGVVTRFNHAAAVVLSMPPSELRAKALSDIFTDINPIELATFFHKKDHDICLQSQHGDAISISHRISDIYHYLLKLTLVDALSSDVFDGLTDLLDQNTLLGRMEDLISVRSGPFAVVVLTIANFQNFVDTLPESVLEALLLNIGQTLNRQLSAKALLAYVASDRFVVVFPAIKHESAVQQFIGQLLHPFAQQLSIATEKVQLSFTVGYALSPQDGDSAKQLLHNAVTACHHNEVNPKAFYLRYDRAIVELKRQQFEISNSLYAAVEEQQLQLHYQPKISLLHGRCQSAEALLRWHHPKMGWISPALFIPIAERDGQIQLLGQWVLEQCFAQLKQWQQQNLGLQRLAINLSGRQLQDPNLPTQVQQLLQKYQLDPDVIELEITETFLMADIEQSRLLLLQLKQLGLHLAMDDFGTGYSSLAYLAKLPVDVLKLDRSLLIDLEDSPQSASMVRHMIRMAHELGMVVVAEGIESKGQVAILRDMQCDLIQGYVFSSALTEADFVVYVSSNTGQTQWEQFAND